MHLEIDISPSSYTRYYSHRLHHARGGAKMFHTYEVFVDIVEFDNPTSNHFERGTTRYEINAESIEKADGMAVNQARTEHPQATELDARVTRILK